MSTNEELQAQIAISTLVGGLLHRGVDVGDAIRILREVADDYEKESEELIDYLDQSEN